ncbi:MAG: IS3 family transposase [Clostridium sp.]|nr:IS3 family transposase [Clostridium sp.]
MCRVLNIPRSLVYYKRKIRVCNTKLENAVISIFRESKNNYGTRKIKVELKKQDIIASRRKIRQIMKKYRLISNYTVKQYKVHKSKCNEEKIDNVVHREIVAYSAGPNKDAKLVYEAFMNSTINLKKVKIFHTDRGNEFKNKIIDELLDTFEIVLVSI